MRTRRGEPALVIILCLVFSSAGCGMTVEQRNQLANQVIGTAVGGAFGAAIGGAAGGGRGAMIGAASGGLAGLTTVTLLQYQARRTRSAAEESRILGYDRSQGTVVKIQGAAVGPQRVRSGERVRLEMDYAVLAPSSTAGVPVSEVWELWRDGELVTRVPPKQETRQPGGWQARAAITIPSDADPGTYVVRHRVETGTIHDSRETSFVVVS